MTGQRPPQPQGHEQAGNVGVHDPMMLFSAVEAAALALDGQQGPNGEISWEGSRAGHRVTFTPGLNEEGQERWHLRVDGPDWRLVQRFYPVPPKKGRFRGRYPVTPDWPRPEELNSIDIVIDPNARGSKDRPEVLVDFIATDRHFVYGKPFKYVDVVNALATKGAEADRPVGRLGMLNYALGEIAFGGRRRKGW